MLSPQQAERRFDEIMTLPADQRRDPLLMLLRELDLLPGPDNVCLHEQIAIASLALPDADAEALHAPLMRMLAHAHDGLSQDARENAVDGFAEVLLLSASPRSDEFIVRLAGRLVHLAAEMNVERLVPKCVKQIHSALSVRSEERRALLIGQAAPVTPGLPPALRYDHLMQLYHALPQTTHLRLAAITAIDDQTDLLLTNQDSLNFKRTVLNEKCTLALQLADDEVAPPTDRVAALRLDGRQPEQHQ